MKQQSKFYSHPMYMPDDPTMLISRPQRNTESIVAASASDAGIRQRLQAAVQARTSRGTSNPNRTMPVRPKEELAVVPELERPQDPDERVPFSPANIHMYLTRGICKAQDMSLYDEAIRLQKLMFDLEDEVKQPLQVAREAWLRPAAAGMRVLF